MKYLCLGYHEIKTWETMPPALRDALTAETLAYQEELRKSGRCLDDKALQPPTTAATLRFDDGGRVCITDGPFAETREQLGGIMVLEADDLNHAIALMSQLPCMRVGGALEIRPINEEI
jgi:hypothetical protein